MKSKFFKMLGVSFISLMAGYGFFSLGYARVIPGVDRPYNPSAYYSLTDISYADSPSVYALRDLAGSGGNVYDYTRHLKSIITTKNSKDWLNLIFQMLGIDIINSTPSTQRNDIHQKISDANALAIAQNASKKADDLLKNDVFRREELFYLSKDHLDSRTQEKAVSDMCITYATAAQELIKNSVDEKEALNQIIKNSQEAVGEEQALQARADIEAFQSTENMKRDALVSNIATLRGLKNTIQHDAELAAQQHFTEARLEVEDHFKRTNLQKKQYKRSDSVGFVNLQ